MAHPLADVLPVTQDNVEDAVNAIYAPWIRQMGMTDFREEEGYCRCRLPQNSDLHFFAGATCGQALMAAIDTVASLAVLTTDRIAKGTSYQHTHFLRPAAGDDMLIEARVKRFGGTSAYLDASVTLNGSGELVTHAVLEFAF